MEQMFYAEHKSLVYIIRYVLQDNWNSWEFSRRSINGINPSPGESWLVVGLEFIWAHQAHAPQNLDH